MIDLSLKAVFVDEAQDNTTVECRLAMELAKHGRVVLFGDYRQAANSQSGHVPLGNRG